MIFTLHINVIYGEYLNWVNLDILQKPVYGVKLVVIVWHVSRPEYDCKCQKIQDDLVRWPVALQNRFHLFFDKHQLFFFKKKKQKNKQIP